MNRVRTILRLCTCAVVITLFAPQSAQAQRGGSTTRSFKLIHREAADIAQTVRNLLGSKARVFIDVQTNRLILEGTDVVLDEAQQLVETLDGNIGAPLEARVTQAYPVPASQLSATLTALRQRFRANDICIAADQATSRLIVLAVPSVHAAIGVQLQQTREAARAPAVATDATFSIREQHSIAEKPQVALAANPTSEPVNRSLAVAHPGPDTSKTQPAKQAVQPNTTRRASQIVAAPVVSQVPQSARRPFQVAGFQVKAAQGPAIEKVRKASEGVEMIGNVDDVFVKGAAQKRRQSAPKRKSNAGLVLVPTEPPNFRSR